MVAFARKGADIQSSDAVAECDSIIPTTATGSRILVPGDDRRVMSDPTLGDITLTLPDAASNAGVVFLVKRIDNGANILQVAPDVGDTIDGGSNFILGNINEWVELISDGTVNWRIMGRRTFAVGVLSFTNPTTTQAITGAFQKIDVWNFAPVATPGRVFSDHPNNKFEVLNIQTTPGDQYDVNFSASLQYANNVDVDIAVFVDGVETSLGAHFTGDGANDEHISFQGVVSVLTVNGVPQDVDIRVRADSNNDITYTTGMATSISRVGG